MLNNLFKRPTIVRVEQGAYKRHIATIKAEAEVSADMRIEAAAKSFEETLDITIKQRDEAHQEHAAAVDRELHAIEERDAIRNIRDKALEGFGQAIEQRDAAKKQAYVSACDRHAADKERDEAQVLLQRACVLLNEVDPSRTGGKQLRQAREALFADAMLAGLWGEEK